MCFFLISLMCSLTAIKTALTLCCICSVVRVFPLILLFRLYGLVSFCCRFSVVLCVVRSRHNRRRPRAVSPSVFWNLMQVWSFLPISRFVADIPRNFAHPAHFIGLMCYNTRIVFVELGHGTFIWSGKNIPWQSVVNMCNCFYRSFVLHDFCIRRLPSLFG